MEEITSSLLCRVTSPEGYWCFDPRKTKREIYPCTYTSQLAILHPEGSSLKGGHDLRWKRLSFRKHPKHPAKAARSQGPDLVLGNKSQLISHLQQPRRGPWDFPQCLWIWNNLGVPCYHYRLSLGPLYPKIRWGARALPGQCSCGTCFPPRQCGMLYSPVRHLVNAGEIKWDAVSHLAGLAEQTNVFFI